MHPAESFTYENDERRRGWKKCQCPIHVSGKLDRFDRRGTNQTSWDLARVFAARLENAGTWDVATPQPGPRAVVKPIAAPQPPGLAGRITVEDAIARYLTAHEQNGSTEGTIGTYTTYAHALKAASDARGYLLLDQWTPEQLRCWHDSWKLAPGTVRRRRTWVKSFFAYAVSQEWIANNPAEHIVPQGMAGRIVGRSRRSDHRSAMPSWSASCAPARN